MRERAKEEPSCEGLVDHGIMVENWQPAVGSEGRSPLLKNDSSGAKKNAQTYPDRNTHTHAYVPYQSRSQGYEIVLFHIIRLCTSHYCPIPPEPRQGGLVRLFKDV